MIPIEVGKSRKVEGGTYQTEQVFETEVEVSDPEIHKVDGKPDHVTYRLSSASSYPSWNNQAHTVKRRYNDFCWLKEQLDHEVRHNKLPIPVKPLPPLPEADSFFGWFSGERFAPDFIEKRRQDLDTWINIVANHDISSTSPTLLHFLQLKSFDDVRALHDSSSSTSSSSSSS